MHRYYQAMASALRAAKNALRKEIKKRVAALNDAEKLRQSEIVVQKLLNTEEYRSCRRVSVFLHMHDEIRTDKIVADLLASGRQCFIPRYIGTDMDMIRLHSLEDYDSLPETSWKIKQPPDDDQRENALDTGGLDLIIVPGLAFTKDGSRCGRGKGYYDNYLHRCQQVMKQRPTTISLAFNEQLCDTVPMSEEDFTIDKVLFENMDN